jgi:hypothetical protein
MILKVIEFYATTMGSEQPTAIPTELPWLCKLFINIYSQRKWQEHPCQISIFTHPNRIKIKLFSSTFCFVK